MQQQIDSYTAHMRACKQQSLDWSYRRRQGNKNKMDFENGAWSDGKRRGLARHDPYGGQQACSKFR
jgi:hypothetical protein